MIEKFEISPGICLRSKLNILSVSWLYCQQFSGVILLVLKLMLSSGDLCVSRVITISVGRVLRSCVPKDFPLRSSIYLVRKLRKKLIFNASLVWKQLTLQYIIDPLLFAFYMDFWPNNKPKRAYDFKTPWK